MDLFDKRKDILKTTALALLGLGLLLGAGLTGCATLGSASTPSKASAKAPGTNWIFTEAGLEADHSPANTIVVKEAPGTPVEARDESGAFGKVAWFYALLEQLDLDSRLTLEAKEQLYRALFTQVPQKPTPEFYRAVAVAGYFPDGRPLILYLQTLQPSAKGPATWSLVLQMTGNFLVTVDNKTQEKKRTAIPGMVMPRFNWFTNGLILTDGRVVRANNLYSKEDEAAILQEAGDDTATAKANLADLYIKDEVAENDAGIVGMLEEVLGDPKAGSDVKTLAALNLGLYHMAHQELDQAAQAFDRAQTLAATVTEPTIRAVVDRQAPEQLELLRRVGP